MSEQLNLLDSDSLDGADTSPDHSERVQDFLSRHGGGERSVREGQNPAGISGWSEITAADGYRLRCQWTDLGGRREMQFSELPPNAASCAAPSSVD